MWMERNSSTPIPLGHIAVDIRSLQYKWTGQVGCVITTMRNVVKLQEYAFLKQNNFMRIDELPYHYSLFYELNFVSRRQFFTNIGKYPSKMQKVRNDPFLDNKIFKRMALFLIKDDFFEDLYFDWSILKFLGPVLQKVHFAPQVRHLRDGFNAMCDFPLVQYLINRGCNYILSRRKFRNFRHWGSEFPKIFDKQKRKKGDKTGFRLLFPFCRNVL